MQRDTADSFITIISVICSEYNCFGVGLIPQETMNLSPIRDEYEYSIDYTAGNYEWVAASEKPIH